MTGGRSFSDALPTDTPVSDAVLSAVRTGIAGDRPVVLAVSGGLDSMVLLDASMRVAPDRVAAVATFDHGSGSHAREAVVFVQRQGGRRGARVIVGVARDATRSEASWRAARWGFLLDTARSLDATVVTAHTADDQVETVCMRVLRGAGARGVAALYAPSPILRPLLGLRRAAVAEYASRHGVDHLEDPTNASPAYLRNRVRRDLLPAIARVRPGFASEMLQLA